MWPAYEGKSNEVEDAIQDEIAKVMAMVNRRIDKGSI
jgi:hypothetical protein